MSAPRARFHLPLTAMLAASAWSACTSDADGFSLASRVADGVASSTTSPRPAYGTLVLRSQGQTVGSLETRLTNDGQISRRVRLPSFERVEAESEEFHDFAIHPSGEITIALERTDRGCAGYELLRLGPEGTELSRRPLPVTALPDTDLDPKLPDPPFCLRSRPMRDHAEGTFRVAAVGESLVVAFTSLVVEGSNPLVSAVLSLDYVDAGYVARWTRLVDGLNTAQPPIWAYDEFHWSDALVRPLLAVDPVDGSILVGRTFTSSRCRAGVAIFGELSLAECADVSTGNGDDRQLRFAYTVFTEDGVRVGTRTFSPDHFYYFGVFGMAAYDGDVVLVGTTSWMDDLDQVVFYDGDKVPFDGLVALLSRDDGRVVWERHVDVAGRADSLMGVRFDERGIVAAGASGWDRWDGGMSVSRGAHPWLVHLDRRTGEPTVRDLPQGRLDRHSHLFDLVVLDSGTIVAAGLDDAPMTHSGDDGTFTSITFGDLRITIDGR